MTTNLTDAQRQAMSKMFDTGAGYGEIIDYLQDEGFGLDQADRLTNDYANFCVGDSVTI